MWVQEVSGGGVRALAFAPDGRTLYTRDAENWVTAWDTGDHTGTRLFRAGAMYHHLPEPGFGVAGGGRFLVADGLAPFVFDLRTSEARRFDIEQMMRPDPGDVNPAYTNFGQIHPDPFAPRFLALLSTGVMATWDLDTWRPGPDLSAPAPHLLGARFRPTPFGHALLRHRDSSEVSLFDAAAGGFVSTFKVRCPAPHFEALPAPGGRVAVIFFGKQLLIWDSARWTRGGPIKTSPPGAAVAFHPTEPVFAALNGDKVFTLFHLGTGKPIRSLDFALGKKVQCACFAPDGLTCAVGGSNKRFVVFDVDL
jgi:WD40 repeat protein